jgi:hypothetical protein
MGEKMHRDREVRQSVASGRIGAAFDWATAALRRIPNNLTMEIRNRSTGSSVSMSFSNVDYGGTSGTSERNRGTTWLTGQGCT